MKSPSLPPRPAKPKIPEGWSYVGYNAYHGCHILERRYRGWGVYKYTTDGKTASLSFYQSGNRKKIPTKWWKKEESTTATAERHAAWHMARRST